MAEHRLERVRAVRRPRGAPRRRRPVARRRARRRAARRPPSPRRWSTWAGWPAGPRCRCRCATPAAPAPACAQRLADLAAGRRARPARPAGRQRRRRRCGARGVVVRYGDVVAVARGRPRPARRRGHRADGPQRRRQVHAAVGPAGRRTPRVRHGPRRRSTAPTPRSLDARRAARLVGLVPQSRATCSTSTPSPPSAPRPTARAGAARARAPALLDRLVPGVDPRPHPRDLSEGQRLAWSWPSSSPPPAACSCSTSRPAASTTPPRRALRESCASWPPRAAP